MGTPLRERLQALLAWVATPEGSPIDAWRRRILAAVLVGLTVLGGLAYVIGAGLAWSQGEHLVVIVDTVVYGLIVAMTVGRRLPYRLRAATLVALPAVLGTYFLFDFGFDAAGFPWLLSFPVLASLLLGVRGGTMALAMTAGILIVLGALIPSNVMPWTAAMPKAMLMWWVSSSSVLAVAALLGLSIGFLSDGLGAEAMARRAAEVEADRRQRLAALGTLSGGIAHDFNNLLQPIISDAEHAQRLLARGQDARPALDDILHTADRARMLVRRILTFARPVSGGRDIVDLGALVTESKRLLAALVAERITLEVEIEAPVFVAAEPSELQQVLLNLVNNAAHAMPQGGTVRIAVGVHRSSADLVGTVLDGIATVAMLRVTDTGVGMDRETLSRIFEPFYTTKGPRQGTGLGLATVHATITALGGMVRADSTPGRGTRMEVLLPATEASPTDGTAPRAGATAQRLTPPSNRAIGRVVVIDDEPAVLAGTTRLLERMGYLVTPFGDPAAALTALLGSGVTPDLVLTDLAMPGMSGWDVAEQVHARHPGVPVVVMTGHVASTDDEAVCRPGVRAVIAKPFTAAELQAVLRALTPASPPAAS
jgi:signal transduction histidine kinase/CheY-like chemotaxis protein